MGHKGEELRKKKKRLYFLRGHSGGETAVAIATRGDEGPDNQASVKKRLKEG